MKTRQDLQSELKANPSARSGWTAEQERIHDVDVSDADLAAIQTRLNVATPAEQNTPGYKLLLNAWNAYQFHRDNGERVAMKSVKEALGITGVQPVALLP